MKKINLNNIVIIFTMTIIFSFLTFNNIYKQNINYLSIISNNKKLVEHTDVEKAKRQNNYNTKMK